MAWDINGRTVLITGAARGIGAQSAARLHARGANVALVGLEPDLLEELADRLGDRAAAFEADVSDADALDRAVAATVDRFGGIDVSVANAGLHFVGSVTDAPIEQIKRVLDVNLHGVLHTMRAVAPHVRSRKGYMLSVASLAAASHAPLMGPYATSKAGVEALTNCLRQELRPAGVSVGCAYFGFIDTDLVRGGLAHPASQTLDRMLPAFVRKRVSVDVAAAAIERGVVGRKARVWAPRYVGGALATRGVMQPLAELRIMRDRRLAKAIDLADPSNTDQAAQDPVLGIAIPGAIGRPATASTGSSKS